MRVRCTHVYRRDVGANTNKTTILLLLRVCYYYYYIVYLPVVYLRPVYATSSVIFMVGRSNLYPGIGNVWEYKDGRLRFVPTFAAHARLSFAL